MPSISPSNIARNTLLARLSDPTTGFNPNYILAQGNYTSALAPNMVIDFTTTSKNCFVGQIEAGQIVGSSAFTFPLVTLYSKAGANRNLEKFGRFSGPVRCYVNFYLSDSLFKSNRAIHDFETWGDAVEGAMVETVNNASAAVQSSWTGNCIYNGDIGFEKYPLTETTSSNWLQKISFLLTLDVRVL